MTLHVTVTPWAWVTTMTLTFQTLSPVWASSSARRSSSSSRSVVLALPCRPTTPSLVRSGRSFDLQHFQPVSIYHGAPTVLRGGLGAMAGPLGCY